MTRNNSSKQPNILLLSGYDAASHRYWRQLLAEKLTEFNWTQLALPDRNFSWRVRGSSLNFAYQYREEMSQQYDLIIATSMVDFAALRGFLPQLGNIPSIVYFHENQFAYPISQTSPSQKQLSESEKQKNSNTQANLINAQLTSIYSALCADVILFNSQYNQTSFFEGVNQLFKRLPDAIPTNLIEQLKQRTEVLPVPLNSTATDTKILLDPESTLNIVWNHRWEYDKQPEVFFEAMGLLKQAGYSFKLHVLGQSFRNVPDCFAQAEKDFADEIESFGFQPQVRYRQILANADIVVSSALHDFQGLSLMQAINYGCYPVAPDRVAYPEYIPETALYAVDQSNISESRSLFNQLEILFRQKTLLLPNLSRYSQQYLLPKYRKVIQSLLQTH